MLTVVEESEEPVATGPLATLCLEFPDHVESVEIVHESDQYVIGRDGGSCQAEIKDPRASRRHLAIVWTKEGPSVLDLGSTNGSELNGERLGDEPLLLSEGDAIGIGRCRLIVREITVPE